MEKFLTKKPRVDTGPDLKKYPAKPVAGTGPVDQNSNCTPTKPKSSPDRVKLVVLAFGRTQCWPRSSDTF
jgi:hypothetical protein